MGIGLISVTRGQRLHLELCPNAADGACGCESVPMHEHHDFMPEPPDLWPTAEEPWREKAKTEKQIQAVRNAWAKQCATEVLLLAQEKYTVEEPEDITAFVQDGKATV